MAAAAIGTGGAKSSGNKGEKESAATESTQVYRSNEEQALLMEYENVLKSIDPARNEYYQKGKFRILSERDSKEIIPETSFLVAKKGSDCFFQVGSTATYNMGGVYAQVDHHGKRVMLSKQKSIMGQLFSLGKAPGKKLKEEGYKISVSNAGNSRKITLKNLEHLSFKEYAITYDMVTKKVTDIFTRTANDRNPEKKGQGTLIYVKIDTVEDTVDLKNYDPFDIIELRGKEGKLKGRYSSYHLLIM